MGARVHRREARHPDVLKQPKDRELALLIDQRVIREDREIELQTQLTRTELITSPWRIALTTS